MQAKPCKYCKNPVAKKAKKCPSCGGKQPYPPDPNDDTNTGIALILLIVIGGGTMLWQKYSNGQKSNEQQVDKDQSDWNSLSVDQKIMRLEIDIEQLREENIKMSNEGITNPSAFAENDKEIVNKMRAVNYLKSMR